MTAPTIRIACPGDMGNVLQMMTLVHPQTQPRIRLFRERGSYWHDVTAIVCEVAGRIVSCACVFHRCIRTSSGRKRFGGIGCVGTLPDARGRGYARAVLERCEQIMRESGYATALLFCEIVGYYRGMGWQSVEEDYVEFRLDRSQHRAPDYRIESFDRDAPSPAVRTLYDQAYGRGGGAAVRDTGVWEEYARWPRDDPRMGWMAWIGSRPVACVRGRPHGADAIHLMEATVLPDHSRALLPLLSRQVAALGVRDAGFRLILSPEHPLSELLPALGIETRWSKTSAETSTMMVKPVASTAQTSTENLQPTDFDRGLPWSPTTWWGVDRF